MNSHSQYLVFTPALIVKNVRGILLFYVIVYITANFHILLFAIRSFVRMGG